MQGRGGIGHSSDFHTCSTRLFHPIQLEFIEPVIQGITGC